MPHIVDASMVLFHCDLVVLMNFRKAISIAVLLGLACFTFTRSLSAWFVMGMLQKFRKWIAKVAGLALFSSLSLPLVLPLCCR